jgi:serine/threonine protein kinase
MPSGGSGGGGADAAASTTPASARWRRADAAVALAASFSTLRDMVGRDSFVEPSELRFVKRLGEGGFAKVDLCALEQEQQQQEAATATTPTPTTTPPTPTTTTLVAVKRLHPHLVETPRELETFAREATLLRRLRHPNVVRFVGCGAMREGDASSAYVVQEYLSGGTLRQLITRHALVRRAAGRRARKRAGVRGAGLYRVGDAVDIMLQVAKALEYLHARTPMVIHRDVKPDNVLLQGPWPETSKRGAGGGGMGATPDASSTAPAHQQHHPQHFVAKLTDFGLSATVEARKATAMRALAGRASQRCGGGQGGSASASSSKAAVAGLKAQEQKEEDPEPLRRLAAEGEQALFGGGGGGANAHATPRGRSLSAAAAANGPDTAAAAFDHRLDAAFDRRLSSCAMLSPALLRAEQQQKEEEEQDDEQEEGAANITPGRRPASAPAAASSAAAPAADPSENHHNQVYELTAMTGSLLYMSPEVFCRAATSDGDGYGDGGQAGAPSTSSSSSSSYNEKADVFSFGIMLREILAAYLLSFAFRDQAELEAYAARVSRGYRPPIDERWPEPLRALISDCWQQDPRKRPAMGEVVKRLEAVAAAEVAGRRLPRVATDGGGWEGEMGEVGGQASGGQGRESGAGRWCCALM